MAILDEFSEILQSHCGKITIALLDGIRKLAGHHIAGSLDMDAIVDHLTTNISPAQQVSHSVDFCFRPRLPVRRLLCPLVASSALLVALPSLALTIKWSAGHTAYFEQAGEALGSEQRAGLAMLLNHVGLAPCRLDIVTVVGHSDSLEAPAPARLALSVRRAEYVKGMLVRLGGVDPSKIYVEGRGSAQQLGRPGTRANRRVEIEAVGQAMSACAKE